MRDDPLSITALRYAARDLPPVDAAAFEVRLAVDQSARDALAEAVRLSAAALGQPAPAPMPGFVGLIADRLSPTASAVAGLFRHRAYRGHPMTWAGLGALAAAAAVTVGVWLADPPAPALSDFAAACPPPDAVAVAAPKPADVLPAPRAAKALPLPMAPTPARAATNPPADPMATASPAERPKPILPDTDTPGPAPDDTFRPIEPTSRQ